MAAPPVEGDARREVADAPGLDLEVGRLEQHREVGVANGVAAVEQGGEGVVRRRQLLAAEEEQGDVDRPGIAPRQLAHELERDGDAALHVACAAPVDGAVLDAARDVLLGRHGVVVAREHEQRRLRPSFAKPEERLVTREDLGIRRGNEAAQAVADHRLVQALRRDVDELERPRGESVGQRAHPASLPPGAGTRLAAVRRGILRPMTSGEPELRDGPEPERGLLLAVLPKGVDAEDELGELRELARTAGVEPVAEIVQRRDARRPAQVRREGQARGAEGVVPGPRGRRCCSSTTSSRPCSSALSRTRSPRASSTGRS